jgi:hypothetical protein
MLLACGKKGPPLPPLKRGPDRMTSVSARQEGSTVVLIGQLPEHSQDGGPLAPLVEVRVYRLDRGGVTTTTGTTARAAQRSALRQFNKDAQRIASVTGESLSHARSGRRFLYVDTNPVGGPIPSGGKDLTYGLVVVDAEKRASTLSPFATIRIAPPPDPPLSLRVELSEKTIRLSWDPPQGVGEKESPLYNVYRSEIEGFFMDRPRNEHPLTTPGFDDKEFAFGTHYYYTVRSVLVTGEVSRESQNSTVLQVFPQDVFAPATPSGFAVSAEGSVMKLYWFPNDETDLTGYRIYRSERENSDFAEIARVGPSESSYIDQAVKPGVRYYYSLTAFDHAEPANESGHSEVRSDRIPPVSKPAPKKRPRQP